MSVPHDHSLHAHDHSHGHGHDHAHAGDDYFLDQLCLIALSGAFGAVCLTMYFWKTAYLSRILAPQFFEFILLSGIALMILFVVRAVSLWKMAGTNGNGQNGTSGHSHAHDHGHHHHEHGEHEHHHHEHGEHEHHHEHGDCDHTHDHEDHEHCHESEHHHHDAAPVPAHAHAPGHDHGHDHGFAPWRYVILIIPIVLFLLDLPRPKKPRPSAHFDLTHEVKTWSAVTAAGFSPLGQLSLAATYYTDDIDPTSVQGIGFKDLEEASYTEQKRKFWEGQVVEVVGKFSPSMKSDRVFSLVRFRISCCAADLIPYYVDMISKEPVASFQNGDWVSVKGRVTFQKQAKGPGYVTVLEVPKAVYIQPAPEPASPYLQ